MVVMDSHGVPADAATVVRRARIPDRLLPVAIYDDTAQPIPAVWLAIVYWEYFTQPNRDRYELQFLDAEGACCERLLFDTLEITEDRAADIVGMSTSAWDIVAIPLPDGVDSAPVPD